MTRPPAGENPIVVSTERPSRIAAMLAPLPRWAITARCSRSGGSAATIEAYDRPWKP